LEAAGHHYKKHQLSNTQSLVRRVVTFLQLQVTELASSCKPARSRVQQVLIVLPNF